MEGYSLHANNSPLDEYCFIKIELILKYTLPTSSFINNYSLGGFVVPFDNFNMCEAIFTRVDLRAMPVNIYSYILECFEFCFFQDHNPHWRPIP